MPVSAATHINYGEMLLWFDYRKSYPDIEEILYLDFKDSLLWQSFLRADHFCVYVIG